MAHIAIVETYPYEAVRGGEAVYLDQMRQFLMSRGHQVETVVTDVARGRASPVVHLRSGAGRGHGWTVRRAFPLGRSRLLCWLPILFVRAFARSLGFRPNLAGRMGTGELAWLRRKLDGMAPNLVILAFDASRLTGAVAASGRAVVALPGFFGGRVTRIGEAAAGADRPPPETDMAGLAEATIAGLNNSADLEYYRTMTGATNGVLIGMGFPDRRRAPPSEEPCVLFVGARTKPNMAALRWFVRDCWPIVLAAVPCARFRVVGSSGAALARAAAANVDAVGIVDDLDAEYARAQLVVAPLLVGTNGVKTKVVEALAHGRPVVSTSIGVDLENPDQFGEAVEIADEAAAFASAVARMLIDRTFRLERTAAVRQFERQLGEDVAYAPLIGLLASLEQRR